MANTFVVLDRDHRLPASQISFLLGRFVTRLHTPLFKFTPDNPRTYLDDADFADPVTFLGSDLSSSTSNADFEFSLRTLLQFGANASLSQEINIQKSKITVMTLAQPSNAFEKMLGNKRVRAAVEAMMGPECRPIYMIVSIKSVDTGTEGTVAQGAKGTTCARLEGTVPISAAGTAAGVPIPDNMDPKLKIHATQQAHTNQIGQLDGEQVCAIEYYTVETRNGGLVELGESTLGGHDSLCDLCCWFCCLCWCCRGQTRSLPFPDALEGGYPLAHDVAVTSRISHVLGNEDVLPLEDVDPGINAGSNSMLPEISSLEEPAVPVVERYGLRLVKGSRSVLRSVNANEQGLWYLSPRSVKGDRYIVHSEYQ